MGWESSSIFQVLIVAGSTGSGVFVYSPSPGHGNLVASITAGFGTDPYGNAYLAGVTSYSSGGALASEMTGGLLSLQSAGAIVGSFELVAGDVAIFCPPGGTANIVFTPSNGKIVRVASPLTVTQALTVQSGGATVQAGGASVTGGLTADSEIINAALAGGLALQVNNSTTPASSPLVRIQTAGTGDGFLSGIVSGDTNPRISLTTTAAGLAQILFGPGNAAADVFLRRTAASVLSVISGLLAATAGLSVTGGETADTVAVSSGQAAGKVLSVTNTTATPTAPTVQLVAQAVADLLFGLQVTGDTNQRFEVSSDGTVNWGPGNAATDTSINRSAANQLTMSGRFIATALEAVAAATGSQAFEVIVNGDTNPRLQATGAGQLDWGPGNAATDTHLSRAAANLLSLTTADLDIATAGRGLQIKEGTNARMGRSVLVAGTVVVSNTSVTAATEIFLTCNVQGGTPGFLRVSARTAGTSFTILSGSGTDTSTVSWLLVEPG